MLLGVGFEVLEIYTRLSLSLPDSNFWILCELPTVTPAPCLPVCHRGPTKTGMGSPSETVRHPNEMLSFTSCL